MKSFFSPMKLSYYFLPLEEHLNCTWRKILFGLVHVTRPEAGAILPYNGLEGASRLVGQGTVRYALSAIPPAKKSNSWKEKAAVVIPLEQEGGG